MRITKFLFTFYLVFFFIIALLLSGCAKAPAEKPSDFELVFFWHTGSLPPPYDYGYEIRLGPDISGKFNYWSSSGRGEFSRDLTVNTEQLADLYSYLFENGLLRNRWEDGDPIDGAPVTLISVIAGGKSYNIPEISEISESERAAVSDLMEKIKSLVLPEIWEEAEEFSAIVDEPLSESVDIVTNLTIDSTNGAYMQRMPIDWDYIGSQKAYVNHSYGNTHLLICIANFESDENLKDVDIGENQAVLVFSLRIREDIAGVPIKTGVYDMFSYDESDLYVSSRIRLNGGVEAQIAGSSLITSDFEVLTVSENEITGIFNIEDKWTRMSGEFNVPF